MPEDKAVVLEMARILSRYHSRHAIIFACWNGEENGPNGSREFVQQLIQDGRSVALYLHNDSIAVGPQQRLTLDTIDLPRHLFHEASFKADGNPIHFAGDFVVAVDQADGL